MLDVAQKIRVDVPDGRLGHGRSCGDRRERRAGRDTTSAALGTTVTGKQIDQLELNGRNFTQLVTLTPGVVNQTGPG